MLGRHDPAERARQPDRHGRRRHGQPQLERLERRRRRRALQRLPSAPAPASRPAPPTGSRSRPGRAIPTAAWRPAPTTTRCTAEDAAGNVSQSSNEAPRPIADTTPPSAPSGSPRPRSRAARSTLTWTPATDNVGVAKYNVHRSTPRASPRARPTGSRSRPARATPTRRSPPAPTSTRSSRGRGRQRRPRLERGGSDHRRHDAADRARQPDRNRRRGPGVAPWTRLDRQHRRRPVRRLPLDDAPASRPAPPTGSRSRRGTSYTDTGLAAGTYFYKVQAEDAAGNLAAPRTRRARPSPRRRRPGSSPPTASTRAAARRPPTAPATATPARSRTRPGRRAASSATRSPSTASNAWVNVADSNSLDLTTGMTLEAWVKPTVATAASRRVVLKEQAGQPRLRALREHRHRASPQRQGDHRRDARRSLAAPSRCPLDTWTHLAATYDGSDAARCTSTARQVAQPAATGSIADVDRRRCGSAATRSGASSSTAGSTRCASTTAR